MRAYRIMNCSRCVASQRPRRGATAVLMALLLVPFISFVALGVDLGYIALVKTELQAAADSAAVAAAAKLHTDAPASLQVESGEIARSIAALNRAGGAWVTVDPTTDVEYGFWDAESRAFQSPRLTGTRINAVKVRAHRDAANAHGPINLFFAGIFGVKSWEASVEAVAYVSTPVPSRDTGRSGTRFLIDDEMFDTDVPSIMTLAATSGVTPDHLLSSKNETSVNPLDWFINLPAGARLELPTGQVGDEGLLDVSMNLGRPDLPQYPFTSPQDHVRMLTYNDTSVNDPVSLARKAQFKDMELDPLPGVGRFNQPSRYPELVNPDFVHVSPVYKSDLSALDGTDQADAENGPDLDYDGKVDGHTVNKEVQKGANAKGYRRGLVAFRIVGYRIDPARRYPYLPNLIIEIVDPTTIDVFSVLPVTNTPAIEYRSGGVQNVRLCQ